TGNTQIYPLSAISLLNVRYGLAAILAVAVFPVVWLSQARSKLRFFVLLLLILIQYGWLLADGPRQLAVLQEPFRNTYNTREARARAKLADYLRENPPNAKIMLHSGELGQTVLWGGLKFRDLVFEGLSVWHSVEVPAEVESVIVREGDQLWQRLNQDSRFQQDFQLIYSVAPLPKIMVWRRRAHISH
ncbi:MAG: hypothetical protein AB1489_22260, partial [Acidobacteriota bacterium]